MGTGASSALVLFGAAAITAVGTILASLVASRRVKPPEPQQLIPKPRRVKHSDRIHRLEQWRSQYADPLLHKIANTLEWEPDDDDTG